MTNIYELSKDLQAFFDSLPDTGELDEEALARYAELNDMAQDKLKSTAYAYLNLKSKGEAIASEIKRLQDLKKSNDSQMARVEKLLDFGMGLTQSDKQDFGNVIIGYRKSVGTIITDEDLVPDEFKKEKVTISIDLVKAKEVLKNGGEVAGVQLEERKNLYIK
jgi:hypothetical protein